MANDSFPPTLDPLIAAIEAAIRARFPGFASVEFHREANAEGMPLPACLLAMTRCDRSRDNNDGSGLLQATLRFEARIALPATDAPQRCSCATRPSPWRPGCTSSAASPALPAVRSM